MALKQSDFNEILSTPVIQNTLKQFKVNLSSVVEAFIVNSGDIGYEELNCVGMRQGAIDWLTATFKIKRPYGYMGNEAGIVQLVRDIGKSGVCGFLGGLGKRRRLGVCWHRGSGRPRLVEIAIQWYRVFGINPRQYSCLS